MSTSYYALRHPAAAVVAVSPRSFTVRDGVGRWLATIDLDALGWIADRDIKVAHRSGGTIVVTHPGPDDMRAISEYGELVTLGQLRRGEAP